MDGFLVVVVLLVCVPVLAGFALLVRAGLASNRGLALEAKARAAGRMIASGEAEAGAAALEAALGASPTPLSLARAGRLLIEEGAPEAGRALTERARKAAPEDENVIIALAQAYVADGMPESAEALMGPLTKKLRREKTSLYLELARLYAGTGDLSKAHEAYERSLAHAPDLEVAAEYARSLLDEDDDDEAARKARDVIEMALDRVRRAGEEGLYQGRDFESALEHLSDLHAEAVERSGPVEKGINAHAAAGLLDGSKGINYTLVGYSKLVDSERQPRRLRLPSQAALEEASRAGAAKGGAAAAAAHEDRGLHSLRAGDPAAAIRAFREALAADDDAWPSMVGLGAAMRAAEFPPHEKLAGSIGRVRTPARLEELVPGFSALTEHERRYLAFCAAPLAWAIPRILEEGGRFHITSLDARITDLPEFRDARGESVEEEGDGRRYDAIGGLACGPHAAVRVEELYVVSPEGGWTAAHELAHAVLAVADAAVLEENRALWERFCEAGYLGNSYALTNEDEFFACGYERFVMRRAFPDHGFDELHDCDREHGVEAFFERLAGRR